MLYFDLCVVSRFPLLGNCGRASAAMFFFPGIYSIYDPYSPKISLQHNTQSVLKFSHIIFYGMYIFLGVYPKQL